MSGNPEAFQTPNKTGYSAFLSAGDASKGIALAGDGCAKRSRPAAMTAGRGSMSKKVLNVGGNSKAIAIPKYFEGWSHDLLDVDPRGKPDLLCDARMLATLAPNLYDAVYCSHNLEHYFAHEVPKVLRGFHHVLKPDGFAEIRVPDIAQLMRTVAEKDLDLLDVIYQSPAGPVRVRDVLYGFGPEIERSGQDFYAHKTGFSPKSLALAVRESAFAHQVVLRGNLEIRCYAFKQRPDLAQLEALGLHSLARQR
jgi:methyltransferase family protein